MNPYEIAQRDFAIVDRYLSGDTQERIAKDYGLSKMRVCQILRDNDIMRWQGGASLRSRLKSKAVSTGHM